MEFVAEHEAPGRSRFLRGLILSVVILAFGIVSMRMMSKMRQRPKKKSGGQALSLKVQTQRVTFAPILLNLKGYGTAEADQKLDVVPEVGGRAVYVLNPFKEGTLVRKGQLLLRIDPSDYALEYQRLKATVAFTKKQIQISTHAYQVSSRNLNRSRRLVQRKALDPSSFERTEEQHLDRSQRLESLRQTLEVSLLQMKRAALNLRRTNITAPFHARIARGQLARGTFIAAGRTVATLESVEVVEIPVSFSLDSLRKIRDAQGNPVPLQRIPAALKAQPPASILANQMSWKGTVSRIGANIDLGTRTLTLYVRVDLKQQKQVGNLLPGTFCHVNIPVRNIPHAFSIPRSALYRGKYVYTAEKYNKPPHDMRLARHTVQVAYRDSEIAILTGGLRNGDRIITTQLADPIPGTPVFTNEK